MNTVFKGVVIGGDTHAGCVMRCLRHGTLSQKRSFFCSNKCIGIIIELSFGSDGYTPENVDDV